MIRYCYTLDYDIKDTAENEVWVWRDIDTAAGSSDPAPVFLLDLHGQMYSIAKKYGIKSLEHTAASRFHCLSAVIAKTSLWSRLPFGDLVRMVPKLQEARFEGSKTSYLCLVDTIAKKIVEDTSLLNHEDLKEVCREYPGFASDVRERIPHTPTEVLSGVSSHTDS